MKLLAVGAHQDDNEFRCGGLAHKYVQLGWEVRFLSLTDGSGGHHIMTPEQTVERRAKESAAVAQYLGIRYDVWDIRDSALVPDLAARERLICYIREYAPDLIISHRTNDYHPDHRAAGQLVQDATYLLTVPHTCPQAKALRKMPVVMYYEDAFKNPVFEPEIVLDMDGAIDVKLHIAHLNVSQVYEWLPYNGGYESGVPEDEAERFEWLKGMNITADTTDEQVLSAGRGYAVRYARTAARFRQQLVMRYGPDRGSRVRFAEAFGLSDYGRKADAALLAEFFPF